MSFERAFAVTMQHEGGYSNHPKDKGGPTYMDIARTKHPQWAGWPIIDACLRHGRPLSLAPGLPGLVREFSRAEFWQPLRGHLIDPVSEAGVNCGPGNGVKFPQRALNALNARARPTAARPAARAPVFRQRWPAAPPMPGHGYPASVGLAIEKEVPAWRQNRRRPCR